MPIHKNANSQINEKNQEIYTDLIYWLFLFRRTHFIALSKNFDLFKYYNYSNITSFLQLL